MNCHQKKRPINYSPPSHSIALQQTQTIEYERDGVIGRRLVEGRAQPLGYTVNKQVVVFLARDITERKRKEDEISGIWRFTIR